MCCTVPLNARLEAGTGTGDYISFVACCHRFERNEDDNEDRAKLPRRLRNEILSLSSFFNPIQLCERNKTKDPNCERRVKERSGHLPSKNIPTRRRGVAVSTQGWGWILTQAEPRAYAQTTN